MTPAADPGRRSRLASAADRERVLLFADLHNHSHFSDGRADAEQAFALMRRAGLDVAALTDHASTPRELLPGLSLDDYPDPWALAVGRQVPPSIGPASWERTAELADAHDVPGSFTALRGFEWTEPWLGHANVWFSDTFTPVTTPGRLDGLQAFLTEDAPDAVFGYNHPGREPGRLAGFAVPADRPRVIDQLATVEIFNRGEDFLFEGWAAGRRSPIADCLDAGWRPGLIGSSDEHGRAYGLAGRGRAGLWATDHSREGVRQALLERRSYATREVGLRLDATLDDVPMGGRVRRGSEPVELVVDCAGSTFADREVELQVLTGRPGAEDAGIAVVHRHPFRVGTVARTSLRLPDDATWLVLRVADPTRSPRVAAPDAHPANCWALAYASPWYLT